MASSFNGSDSIVSSGGGTISKKGFVIGTSTSPTIENENVVEINSSNNSISGKIDSLTPNSTYYIRMFAVNESGTYYSSEKELSTQDGLIYFNNLEYFNISNDKINFKFSLDDGGWGEELIEYGVSIHSEQSFSNPFKIIKNSSQGFFDGLEEDTKYYLVGYYKLLNDPYGEEIRYVSDPLPETTAPSNFKVTINFATNQVSEGFRMNQNRKEYDNVWINYSIGSTTDTNIKYVSRLGVEVSENNSFIGIYGWNQSTDYIPTLNFIKTKSYSWLNHRFYQGQKLFVRIYYQDYNGVRHYSRVGSIIIN